MVSALESPSHHEVYNVEQSSQPTSTRSRTEAPQSTRPTFARDDFSIHAYRANPSNNHVDASLDGQERATVDQLERSAEWPRQSIITVRPSGQFARNESPLSSTSSGLSLEEVTPPEPVLHSLEIRGSGTYKCIVANINEIEDMRTEMSYALQPLGSYTNKIATEDRLQALIDSHPLPTVTGSGWFNKIRYDFFSVYRRLHALALTVNLIVIVVTIALSVQYPDSFTYADATTAVAANLFVATIMRHEHCINALFHLVLLLPHSTPLCIRRHLAKIYSYGGLHSGCGISAVLWYIFFAALVTTQFRSGTQAELDAICITTALMIVLFFVLVIMAYPTIRSRFHNQWELSHRYSGWAAIGIIWAQTFLIAMAAAHAEHRHLGIILVTTPAFWFLIAITCLIIYPWLHLRRRRFEAEQLSSHAVRLWFNYSSLPACVGTRLSGRPLLENHGFATIPNPDGEKGYSVIVSNNGDWTKNLINNPPTHLWLRGAHTIGVARISLLFRPVVVVATGSGIGPCLSFLQVHPDWPVRIIWSARLPEATYGTKVMDAVLRADKNAIIINTKKTGHPKLVSLTYALMQEAKAEAMVIISNPRVTREVVYGLETRKVPAFGAIFDS